MDEVCLFNCNDKQVSIANSRGNHNTVYYALEGLFDFVKTDEDHRFGMILGIGIEQGVLFINRPNKIERLDLWGIFLSDLAFKHNLDITL